VGSSAFDPVFLGYPEVPALEGCANRKGHERWRTGALAAIGPER